MEINDPSDFFSNCKEENHQNQLTQIRNPETKTLWLRRPTVNPPVFGVAARLAAMLCCSQLLGAVGAVDLFSSDDKALVGQRQRTLLAVEAILVPGVTLVVHHVGAMAEPCKGTVSQVQKNTYTHIYFVFMNVKMI